MSPSPRKPTESEIDTTNYQAVSVTGRGDAETIVVLAPRQRMTRKEALVHAAWLVILAGDDIEDFLRVLEAVRST